MNKRLICFFMITMFFSGCSLIPKTSERFERNIKYLLGKNMSDKDMWGYNEPYKLIRNKKTKEWYQYSKYRNCRYILITDLNDTIISYKILTPDTCKMGISATP